MATDAVAQVRMTHEEKQMLEDAAKREGVSVSLYMYRRIFNEPTAMRRPGRRPKHQATPQNEDGLFKMTG